MLCFGGAHVTRAVSAAGVVVALSLTFHLLGGGSAPEPGTLLGLTVLTTVAAAPLTRRRARLPGLLLLLALAQVGLHFGFVAGAGHGVHGAHGAPLPMVVHHVVATALTALLLLHGRSLLRRGWRHLARRRLAAPPPLPTRPQLPVPVGHVPPAPTPGIDAVMGRAPPSLVRPAVTAPR